MKPTDHATNPYATPQHEPGATASASDFEPVRRIPFVGPVSRSSLWHGFRPCISWPVLGFFALCGTICLAASPVDFYWPWRPRFYDDWVGELAGVGAVGFLLMAIWHVLQTCSSLGLLQRERQLLQEAPRMYDGDRSGWLDQEGLAIGHHDSTLRLRWQALCFFRANEFAMLLGWGNGATGSTILTPEMFETVDEYERVSQILPSKVTPALSAELIQLRPLHLPDDLLSEWPADDQTLGIVRQDVCFGAGIWYLLREVPLATLRASKQLNAFCAAMIVVTLIFVPQPTAVLGTIIAGWLMLQILAILISIYTAQNCLWFRKERMTSIEWRFTDNCVAVASTVGFYVCPMKDLRLVRRRPDRLWMASGASNTDYELRREDFATPEQFDRVADRLQQLSSSAS